jgi:hypothetical protein
MISSCPDTFTDQEVVANCERPENYADFYKLQPVTSLSSNETFKNLDCALCNAEDRESVVTWQPKISCKRATDIFQITSWDELRKRLLDYSPTCFLDFVPPSLIYKDRSKRCYKEDVLIKTCNYTSEWIEYDASIASGCHMDYNDPYIYCRVKEVGLVYKNVFCAMCNVRNWRTDLFIKCPKDAVVSSVNLVSFSALLDFRGSYSVVENKRRECPEQHVYDPVMVCIVEKIPIIRYSINIMI